MTSECCTLSASDSVGKLIIAFVNDANDGTGDLNPQWKMAIDKAVTGLP